MSNSKKHKKKKGMKIYKCTLKGCSKVYTNLRSFKYHKISHKGEKIHRCPLKGKNFPIGVDLPNYSDCKKEYLTKSLLNRHIKFSKQHEGDIEIFKYVAVGNNKRRKNRTIMKIEE